MAYCSKTGGIKQKQNAARHLSFFVCFFRHNNHGRLKTEASQHPKSEIKECRKLHVLHIATLWRCVEWYITQNIYSNWEQETFFGAHELSWAELVSLLHHRLTILEGKKMSPNLVCWHTMPKKKHLEQMAWWAETMAIPPFLFCGLMQCV